MSAAIEDMYLYTKFDHIKSQGSRKRHASVSSDDDASSPKSASPIDDDRRAHHNELERKRRDHIKDHFGILKDSIPLLEGEKSSRALILKRAVEYIAVMQSRLAETQRIMEELRRRNELLEERLLEREPSVSPPSKLPSLAAAPVPMAQITMPVAVPQFTPIPQIPQNANPIVLSTMDPVQLNNLIVSSQDAIIALTQSLFGKPTSSSPPSLPESVASSVSPPAGLYPTTFPPHDQLAVQF